MYTLNWIINTPPNNEEIGTYNAKDQQSLHRYINKVIEECKDGNGHSVVLVIAWKD